MQKIKNSCLAALFAVGVFIAADSQAQSFLTNGLVAYYPFNGNANDASGNGYNLINNGATFGTDKFGNANSAAVFSAGNSTPPVGNFNNGFGGQWMSFGTSKPLDNQSAITVSMWLKPGNFLPPAGGNAAAAEILYQEKVVMINQQGNAPQGFRFTFGNGSGWYDLAATGGIAPTNGTFGFNTNGTWVHCVLTADATGQKLFANGVLVLSDTVAFTTTGTNSFTLGLGAYFNGSIDNLRIYKRALTSSEVAQLYSTESGSLSLVKAVFLQSDNLAVGSNYQVQASSDLINWTNQGSVFTATTNYWLSTNYWFVANWNQLFFRVVQQ